MSPRIALLTLVPVALVSAAPEAPPAKALKYHEVLLKRPHNAALFDRFFGAWLDEQPVEALETFLIARAEANGGQEWTVLALYQSRRGQEEPALVSLAKAMAAVPDDPALAMDRAKLRLRRMEFPAARADLAIVLASKDVTLALEAGKLLGKSWLREGKPAEAIQAWDALLAAHPGDEDLLEDLVESATAEGETTQALVYADRLIAASKDPYQKTLRGLRRGDLLVRAGRSDDAVAAYEATLAQVGEGSWLESEVLAQIDKVFRKQDRVTDLLAEMKKLAEANPLRLLIHRQLAKLEIAQGDTDAAIARFRGVLQRSPGNQELREEFIRLLTDGERLDDASVELEKLIAIAPAGNALYLQLAALRSRQKRPDAVLAALKKAHERMGKDEGSGIRIAGLMLQYDQPAAGEALLKQLATAPAASPAPAETLAAWYGRNRRKDEAIALLKNVATGGDAEVVVRAAGSISALGESGIAFDILTAAAPRFSSDPRFLTALVQGALAAGKPAEAVTQAVKLVRSAKQTSELTDSINLAGRVITAADKIEEWRTTLEKQATRTNGETCLLASLIEMQGDVAAVAKLLTPVTDPAVVHFHAALLDRRGEFDEAIAVLTRLATTDEGRKAAYFKDLVELQQRAGKTTEAIATAERWKLSAPGDKAAWITASRLLRESGKPEEAVKMTRQAVARFEGDADLAATLASLHDEAGQWADAEAIYWRLYDESEAPADQARWAAQLAQVAMNTGRTEELEEKFRERARGNQRSLGPLLAQAELARLTGNGEKRRDLLLEAVRLQPKDLDLRLQIATLEEQAGNAERVVAVLEEALPYDNANRVRAALAQAYLRLGQTAKGLRELREMAGKKAGDARATEQTAGMLATSKLYDEAISLLREELPDGGDWRTKYLLATMLEEDGRETEALPWFIQLLEAQGDLPGIVVQSNYVLDWLNPFPGTVRKFIEMAWSQPMAYHHKMEENRGAMFSTGAANMAGPFQLPVSSDEVKRFALFHVLKLGKRESSFDPALDARIRAAGITNARFLSDLADFTESGNQDSSGLLEKYPDEPGLFESMMLSGGQNVPLSTIRKVLEHHEKLSPLARVNAWMRVVTVDGSDQAAWDSLLAAARESLSGKDKISSAMVGYQLLSTLGDVPSSDEDEALKPQLPADRRDAVSKLVIESLVTKADKSRENQPLRLGALMSAGTDAEWTAGVNEAIREFRKGPTVVQASPAISRRQGLSADPEPFELPQLETVTLRSIPDYVLSQFKVGEDRGGGQQFKTLEIAEAVKRSAGFESPVLRLWIAMSAGDEAAITAALALEPAKEEAVDFGVLKAIRALRDEKPAEAFAALEQVRILGTADKELANRINVSLLAVAAELTPEGRAKVAPLLESMLLQCRQRAGQQGAPAIAAQATKLGLTELAKRLVPPNQTAGSNRSTRGPAGFAAPNAPSSQGGTSPLDRISQLVTDKKYEAAAREALGLLRSPRNGFYSSNNPSALSVLLGAEGRAELLKQVDPGNSKSLVKRLEYAAMCGLFGKKDLQLATLEALHRERPEDMGIMARLAFALPADRRDERNRLLTAGALSDDFVTQAGESINAFTEDGNGDDKMAADFFEGIAAWLETADPQALAKANLSWVAYYGQNYFSNSASGHLPDLFEKPGTREVNPTLQAVAERRQSVAKRLALGMLHQPSLAEQGFRLLSGSKCWEVSAMELDEHARVALASALQGRNGIPDVASASLFALRSNQSTRSNYDLNRDSSVNHLIERLEGVESSDAIFPPAYLAELQQANPAIGGWISALVALKTVDQLQPLWDGERPGSGGFITAMLHEGLVKRAPSVPGAALFFLERLAKLKPATDKPRAGPTELDTALLRAALKAAVLANEDERAQLCNAIGKVVYGEKLDWENPDQGRRQALNQGLDVMEEIVNGQVLTPVQTVQLARTLHRLKLPVSDSTNLLTAILEQHPFASISELENHLEAVGCFNDADTWTPLAAWTVKSQSSSNSITLLVGEVSLLPGYLESVSFLKNDLIQRLKDRKYGRFGALLTAAAVSAAISNYPQEQADLVVQALSESADAIAKLPPERLEMFSSLLESLPPGSSARLPASLQGRMNGLDEKRRRDLLKQADDFLTSKPASRGFFRDLGIPEGLMLPLLSVNGDKAADVLLKANRRFTASLSQGQSAGYASYDGFTINQRDQELFDLFAADDSPLAGDGVLAVRFLSRLARSAEGGQFSFSPRYQNEGSGVMAKVGKAVRKSAAAADKANARPDDTRRGLEFAMALPPEIRGDALVSIVCSRFDEIGTVEANFAPEERRKAAGWRDTLGENFRYLDIFLGAVGWQGDTAEGHQLTSDALMAVFADPSVHDFAKQALAFRTLARAAGILDHPEAGEALAAVFEGYCAADRSAVNGWAPTVIDAAGKVTTPAGIAAARRIHAAFWNNTQAPKLGGHATIPERMSGVLLVLAGKAEDIAAQKRILGSTKGSITGNFQTLLTLILGGQYEIAKTLLPGPQALYPGPGNDTTWSRELEDHMQPFLAILTPEQALRFEAQVLRLKPASGSSAPREGNPERALRLAEVYRRNPPKDRLIQTELLCRITSGNQLATTALWVEAAAWVKDCDHKAIIEEWAADTGKRIGGLGRFYSASLEYQIVQAAALNSFLQGNTDLLEKLTADLVEAPVLEKSDEGYEYHGSTQYVVRTCQQGFIDRAAFWIFFAIAREETAGFEQALKSFEALALNADKRFEFEPSEVNSSLAICHFVAHWIGQPERFEALCAKMTHRQDLAKNFPRRDGSVPLAQAAAKFGGWKSNYARDIRAKGLLTIFARPSFGPLVSRDGGWYERMAGLVPPAEIDAIAALPSEAVIPEVRPGLAEFLGKRKIEAKKPEEAIAAFRKSLASCPETADWKDIRSAVTVQLAEVLVAQNQSDDARALIAAMPESQVGDWIRARYHKISATLGVTPVK